MRLGPNTNAPADLLRPKCILCCGEDRATLLGALDDAGLSGAVPIFEHRCYQFWNLDPGTVLIWSGIGTGCLEPLLWEILSPGVIERIALVGTAGRMARSSTVVGGAYVVAEAWSAGTGLDGEKLLSPFRPRWTRPHAYATASSVSTDFFYGFSPRIAAGGYPFQSGRLRGAYDFHIQRGTDLVEMEVAQFYAFCGAFTPAGRTEFIAIKAVSNTIGVEDEQVAHSRVAIAETLKIAGDLYDLYPR